VLFRRYEKHIKYFCRMIYLTFKYISIDFLIYIHNYKIRIEYSSTHRERQETYITRIIVRYSPQEPIYLEIVYFTSYFRSKVISCSLNQERFRLQIYETRKCSDKTFAPGIKDPAFFLLFV